jgi:TPR repeat protein
MTNIQDFSNAQGWLRTSAKMGYVDGIEFKNKTFYHNPKRTEIAQRLELPFYYLIKVRLIVF